MCSNRRWFVCVHNAGRSQMAATLRSHHALGTRLCPLCGQCPAGEINAAVVEAMELSMDISKEFPKP